MDQHVAAVIVALFALLGARPLRAQSTPVIDTLGLVRWLGHEVWADTVPTATEVKACRRQLAELPAMVRVASGDTGWVGTLRTRCGLVLGGRRPRDSTLVFISPAAHHALAYADIARLPYRQVDVDDPPCPWASGDAPDPGLKLEVRVGAVSHDSAVVHVYRRCRAKRPTGASGYRAQVTYFLARVAGRWVIRSREWAVT